MGEDDTTMSEQKKSARATLILLCVAVLAAAGMIVFQQVQMGELKDAKASVQTELTAAVQSKDELISAKETVEKELNEATAALANAQADYDEATGREEALKTEVDGLKADAEKTAKDLETAGKHELAQRTIQKALQEKVEGLNQKITDLETELAEVKAASVTTTTP